MRLYDPAPPTFRGARHRLATIGDNGPSPSTVVVPLHAHDRRLCVVCITAKHEATRAAPRARVNPYAVAEYIRRERGDVWGAKIAFGISYEHALRIRRGWRGDGRWVDPIPYRSRGYTHHGKNGTGPLDIPWEEGDPAPDLRVFHGPARVVHRRQARGA